MTIKDTYTACSIIEGFDGEEHDSTTILRAWAYLIKTRAAWNLQGWYGRQAIELISMGYISMTGRINWKHINATIDQAAAELGLKGR